MRANRICNRQWLYRNGIRYNSDVAVNNTFYAYDIVYAIYAYVNRLANNRHMVFVCNWCGYCYNRWCSFRRFEWHREYHVYCQRLYGLHQPHSWYNTYSYGHNQYLLSRFYYA